METCQHGLALLKKSCSVENRVKSNEQTGTNYYFVIFSMVR